MGKNYTDSLVESYLEEASDSIVKSKQVRAFETKEDFENDTPAAVDAAENTKELFNDFKADVDAGKYYAVVLGKFSCRYDRYGDEYDDKFVPIKVYPKGLNITHLAYAEEALMTEAHYDPADYWHEDPYWYRKPHGVKSPDDELMARAEKKYGNKGDYSLIKGADGQAQATAKPSTAVSGPAQKDYTDDASARQFWAQAKKGIIDYEAFHKAFDDALAKADIDVHNSNNGIFNSYGELASRGCYGKIKQLDSSLASVRALKKLWGLKFAQKALTTEEARKQRQEDIIYKVKHELREVLDTKSRAEIDSDNILRRIKDTMDMINPRELDSITFNDDGLVYVSLVSDNSDWPVSSSYQVKLDYNPNDPSVTDQQIIKDMVDKTLAGDFK